MTPPARRAAAACVRLALAALVALALGAAAPRSAPGAGPRALPSPAAPGSGQPRLALAADGAVTLSWIEPAPSGGHALRFATLGERGFGPPTTVAEGDSFFVNWADVPGVQPFGAQGLAGFWLWRTGAETYAYAVRVRLSDDGGRTWGAPLTLHRDLAGTEHGFVSTLPDGDGVLAVWLDGHHFTGHAEHGAGPDMTLHARRIGSDGTLGVEEEIDARVCDCCPTAMTPTSRGVLVAYRDRQATEVRDIGLVRREQGRWEAPAALHADGWEIAGCPVNGPALAADGDRVVAAWYTEAGGRASVRAARSEDGGLTFGAPVEIAGERAIGRVGVAALPGGAAAVTWLEGSTARARVRVRRLAANGTAGPALDVARTTGARASGVPRIVRQGGRLVFAWTDPRKPSRVRVATLPVEALP